MYALCVCVRMHYVCVFVMWMHSVYVCLCVRVNRCVYAQHVYKHAHIVYLAHCYYTYPQRNVHA